MTFAEELVKETEKMRAEGKTGDEIAAYVDQAIDDWNKQAYAEQEARKVFGYISV